MSAYIFRRVEKLAVDASANQKKAVHMSADEKARIVEAYQAGASLYQLEERFRRSRHAMRNALLGAGVTPRGMSKAAFLRKGRGSND